ncbi:acyl-CoA-binding protein [Fastidiosibacter lacustris]|uniref:acyl-CoA-binding protein n=1 Tax=Fastidiosibacter lacustris TaxID=2056695 RepID=UPI000E3570B9|nr:acyl-CoA-binding protein [Fastidiosibacter lacustris]
MSELEQKFNEMVKAVRNATIEFKPDNTEKLKLYAFYKQATVGDVDGKCPSVLKMVERAKWMAWNSIKGQSKEEAMKGYLSVFGDKVEIAPKMSVSAKQENSHTQNQPLLSEMQAQRCIQKVAVLGAGVMGAQIAAHFGNARIPVVLFDLKAKQGSANALVEASLEKLKKLNPKPFSSSKAIHYITAANYDDDLEKLKDCGLIIEAIAERMDWKQDLYHKIAPYVSSKAILASNTSGLSIKALTKSLPEQLHARFCGVHFFNPPRYMPLVELIPHHTTKPEVLDELETFLVQKLGKSIIRAKDTPNFIANRLGVFSMLATCYYTEKFNIPLEVVDGLTGKKLGRAKSATYRTADVVGLDTFGHVVDTMANNLKDGWEKVYKLPDWIHLLLAQGAFGQKTKKGFYVKEKDGLKVLDLETKTYRLSDQKPDKEVIEILAEKNWSVKLEKLKNLNHPQAQFLWSCFRDNFHYAACLVGEISNYPKDMDLAIRWGFGWKEGIFEIWQQAGWHKVIHWIEEDIRLGKTLSARALPDWVHELKEGVYGDNQSFSFANNALITRKQLPVYDRQLIQDYVFNEHSDILAETLYENEGVRLWTIDGEVGILSFKSKMCAIGSDVLDGISQAIKIVEQKLKAMVIWQEQDIFSAGANLEEFGFKFMMNGKDAVYEVIQKGHQIITQELRYSKIPVVAAVKGFAFGGGCEILLHCDAVVAAHESYIGLVEAGVGIIPGWGGSKEMAKRASVAQDPWKEFEKRYKNLAMAQVATSAYEAIEMGFLCESDTVVMNSKEILSVAIEKAKYLAYCGYQPPLKLPVKVFGEAGIATVKGLLVNMRDGNQISAHDYKIATNLADAMCGGEIEKDTLVSEDWLLKRELENFVELALSEKSAARMQYMLETGKPLRN